MPKSRTKNGSSKNGNTAPAPLPLLDSLRDQMRSPSVHNDDNKSDRSNSKTLTSGWDLDMDDWSDKNVSNNSSETFPRTHRSIVREHEQAKNNFFRENENKPLSVEKQLLTNNIDLIKLISIVNDLITGKNDQIAYTNFLSILQNYSVQTIRDDHLEETIYHLMQTAVSFIRTNQQRFDPLKLQECYHQRHILKTKSMQ